MPIQQRHTNNTSNASNSLLAQNNVELQEAFTLFSQMSAQLESSYRELELKVEQLNKELAQAHSEKLKQLAEKEQLAHRLETLHEAMPAAVIWVDEDQNVLSANQAATEIFNEAILSMYWPKVMNDHFTVDGHDLKTQKNRLYSYQIKSLSAKQGQVVILTDITESRRLQQAVNRQHRLADLGEITAGIAHQIRTPIASALLSIDQILHPNINAELHKKSAGRIKQNLHHLDQLVNDMLVYARDGRFDNHSISIQQLLNNVNDSVTQKDYPQIKLLIHNTLSSNDDAIVSGSGDALLSVITSLIENARQLSADDQIIHIDVKAEVTDNDCIISVIDNGPGLSREQCEQVFKPFYTTKNQGTGLGLAIAKSIIDAHQGMLEVNSALGHGTEMRITLNKLSSTKMLDSNVNSYKQTQSA